MLAVGCYNCLSGSAILKNDLNRTNRSTLRKVLYGPDRYAAQ